MGSCQKLIENNILSSRASNSVRGFLDFIVLLKQRGQLDLEEIVELVVRETDLKSIMKKVANEAKRD